MSAPSSAMSGARSASGSPAAPSWRDAAHVLCVRLDSMGDVLMTTPAFRALKESRPSRRLTLLTSPAGAAVATLLPEIDDVVVYDAPWLKAAARRRGAAPDRAMIERLHSLAPDAAVVFTVYSQNPLPSALLCYLADVPLRLAHCRENPYQLLTDWVPDPEPERLVRHEVRRQLDLVAAIGCRVSEDRLSLRIPDAAMHVARTRLDDAGVDRSRPWLLMHPGASAPSRRYPPEQFAHVAATLAREHGMQVVLTGAVDEVPLVEHVRATVAALHADPPSPSLAGQLDLATLAAAIALAPVIVTNNTGSAHLAAAVGTPVVDLYALTNPQHTPWGVRARVLSHEVPCKFCYKSICPEHHHACLRAVEPAAVVAATLELLAGA